MTMENALNAPRMSQRNGVTSDVEAGLAGSAQAKLLKNSGQRWSVQEEEIGAANTLVFNADGSVTAVSKEHRHGVGSALVQKLAH